MPKSVLSRVTYANVASTLALVLAMSGGALAASHYIITSKKQIKPSVLRSLQGASGQKGAQGTAGKNGANGAPGAQGERGPQGEPGKNGTPGSPWTAGGTLPAGATETGTWLVSEVAENSEFEGLKGFMLAAISFPVPLEAALSNSEECSEKHDCLAAVVTVKEQTEHTAPSACKGTAASPTATPGHLCVYVNSLSTESLTEEQIHTGVLSPAGEFVEGTGTTGAIIGFSGPQNAEVLHGEGTWAVTG